MNKDELHQFLIYCGKKGYATMDDANEQTNDDHSTTITITQGDWKFHDNYFGGEPFGGREVVFYKGKPVWMMAYYGAVNAEITDLGPIYAHLKKALALLPDEAPYRGPQELTDGDYRYENIWNGDIDKFSGKEKIYYKGEKVYFAKYVGGYVDRKV